MELSTTQKLLAIFLSIFALIVFTIANKFITKKEMTKPQKNTSFAVAITGICVMIVVALIVL